MNTEALESLQMRGMMTWFEKHQKLLIKGEREMEQVVFLK